MGMFDTVFVSREVLSGLPFDCPACGRVPGPDAEWQTKSLNAAMDSYVLRHDDGGAIRLYLLDRPSDRRLWRPWTEDPDGVAVEVRPEPPRHEPGFFDDSGGFDP
jgi:hypothetical protein